VGKSRLACELGGTRRRRRAIRSLRRRPGNALPTLRTSVVPLRASCPAVAFSTFLAELAGLQSRLKLSLWAGHQ
jgi:hypothetical protein